MRAGLFSLLFERRWPVGFRQFFKRAVKPAVMVGIVGTLSVSLIVSTPSNAKAFVPPPVVPLVFGATEMILPTLTPVASVLGPVGWGLLAVTAIGVAAYATRDSWVPYVTGAFGQQPKDGEPGFSGSGSSSDIGPSPSPSPTSTTSPSPSPSPTSTTPTNIAQPDPRIKFANARVSSDGRSVTWDQSFTENAGSTTSFSWGLKYECLMDGGWGGGTRVVEQTTKSSNVPVGSKPLTINCKFSDNYGDHWGQIQGLVAGSPGMDGLKPFPTNWTDGYRTPGQSTTWGKFSPKDVDPRTAKTKYVATVECVKNDGTLVNLTAESLGSAGGITLPSCAAAGLGHGTGKITVDGFLDGSAQPKRLLDKPAPVADPNMPLCDPKKPGSGCKLSLSVDGKPCVAGLFECEHWAEVSKDPNQTPRYGCQYGPYPVALALCNPLERAYEPGGAPTTDPNTDGDPGTRSDTGPDGKPQPQPNPDGTIPGVDTPPGTIPGGGASAPPEGSTPAQRECFPSGWSMLNPVEWVLKPVGCALDAAFKPQKDLQSRLTNMQAKFSNKVPVSWFGVGIEGAAAGGCPTDWAVTFDDHRYSLICGTEADNIIRGFRPVLGGMLVMAMLWPFIRSLFYAAIPVFKVTPS